MANGILRARLDTLLSKRARVRVTRVLAPFILEHDPLVLPGYIAASFAASNFTVYPF